MRPPTPDDLTATEVRFDADHRARSRHQDCRMLVRLAFFHGERLAPGAFFRNPALHAAVAHALNLRLGVRRSAARAVR